MIPPAIATFSESPIPIFGMETVQSSSGMFHNEIPSASFPSTNTQGIEFESVMLLRGVPF